MGKQPPVVLYPFRRRDPLTGRWYRARWKASLAEIEAHGGEWIVDGPPHAFESLGPTSAFQVTARAPALDAVELHPHWESPPRIDGMERFLAGLFLRRYATWCTRRSRFAQAQGAAALFRDLHSG